MLTLEDKIYLNLITCPQYLLQTDTCNNAAAAASAALPAVISVGIKYLPQNLLWA